MIHISGNSELHQAYISWDCFVADEARHDLHEDRFYSRIREEVAEQIQSLQERGMRPDNINPEAIRREVINRHEDELEELRAERQAILEEAPLQRSRYPLIREVFRQQVQHLDLETERAVADGVALEEAERKRNREFGSLLDEYRDALTHTYPEQE